MNNLLEYPTISRIRRNHGLEHATIHLLTEAKPGRSVAGHSDAGGFWILGELDTVELTETVREALARLNAGERSLAVHPNCGTNFATYGVFASLGAFTAMVGAKRTRDKLERLPLAAVFATLGIILSQPLAFRLQQRVTTSGNPRGMKIVKVVRSEFGGRTAHRVETAG